MGMTKEEILNLASRYVTPDEMVDFPMDGDVFCLLIRQIPSDKILKEEEGWGFGGYGLCIGYTIDEDAKPVGKWLWMHFASLDRFPPAQQVFKLQPPHVTKGRFQNPDRTHEIRILKISLGNALSIGEGTVGQSVTKEPVDQEAPKEEKLIPFRKKSTQKK